MFGFKDEQQNPPEAPLKNGIKTNSLPPLISDVITDSKCYIDNLFVDTWKKLKLKVTIHQKPFKNA